MTDDKPKTQPSHARELRRLEILRADELFWVAAAAFSGDPDARRLLQAAVASAVRIGRSSKEKQVLCLCCDASVENPLAAYAFLVSENQNEPIIGSAFCESCGKQEDEVILQRARAAFLGQFPGFRLIVVTHPAPGSVQ